MDGDVCAPLYGDGFGMIALQTEKWMIVQL